MPSEVSPWFLELARCPESGSRLHAAESALLTRLNEAIVAGTVTNAAGEPVSQPVEGGLVDPAATRLYPIRSGIVSLVVGDSIPLAAKGIPDSIGNNLDGASETVGNSLRGIPENTQ